MRRTPLTRSTPLQRGGPLERRTELRRTATSRTRPRRLTRTVRDVVLERDQHRCVRCGLYLAGQRYSVHHRKLRSQGGLDVPENLILLCGTGTTLDHGWVHDNPELARAAGYLVHGRADPATVPVLVHGLGLAYPVDDAWQLAA